MKEELFNNETKRKAGQQRREESQHPVYQRQPRQLGLYDVEKAARHFCEKQGGTTLWNPWFWEIFPMECTPLASRREQSPAPALSIR